MRGIVTVYETGDELKVLARNDLEERIMATLALLEGRVYVWTEQTLCAFSLPQQLPGTGDYFSTGRFSSLPHSAQEPS